MLVGFGFSALGISSSYHPEKNTNHSSIWELPAEDWESGYLISAIIFQAAFATSASFALAFNLLSLFIATISSMCGPGMALRGPDGSVQIAVRHMEQQLKRALRFFGRGVVAFIITLTTVGLRTLQDISFAGGAVSILVGIWSFWAVLTYGEDIGEKFHVSADRAVRGAFVSGKDGRTEWRRTDAEERELASERRHLAWYQRLCCFLRQRQGWRPEGHGLTTPLWRLDKMIAFPYHDESRLRRFSEAAMADATSPGGAAVRERANLERLVLHAQGPVEGGAAGAHGRHPAPPGPTDHLSSALQMVSNVFSGGDVTAQPDERGVPPPTGMGLVAARGGARADWGGQNLLPRSHPRS